MSRSADDDEFASLTDQEINLLHRIVLRAERKTGEFGVVLFAAYDDIVARENVREEESSKYFRFILRMVAGRLAGQTAYERLETILLEAGIQITSTDLSGEATEDRVARVDDETTEYSHGHQTDDSQAEIQVNGRHHEEAQMLLEGSLRPVFPTPPAESDAHSRPPRRGIVPHRRARSDNTRTGQTGDVLARGRLNGSRSVSDNFGNRTRRAHSVTSNRSISISRANSLAEYGGDAYSADHSGALSITHSPRQALAELLASDRDVNPYTRPEQRSEEQLDDVALAFVWNKSLIALRRALWEWRHKAVDAQREHDRLNLISERFHRQILVRFSLSKWRSASSEHQAAWSQKEEMFRGFERRTTKYRNRELVNRAFTHWAQVTEDAIRRTGTARRHLLRTKCFKAWKDITAVDELKIRRHALTKFFGVWRQRALEREHQDQNAVASYESHLVRRSYWLWFWAYCDRTVLQWGNRQVAKSYLKKWRKMTFELQERDEEVRQNQARGRQKRLLETWAARCHELQARKTTANAFRHRKMISQHFTVWRRKAQLFPQAVQISALVDRRIIHTALSVWAHYARLSHQAASVHHARILRNAFSDWNDKLRIRCLESRTDLRIRAEMFYKWLLASRSTSLARRRDNKIGTRWFEHWIAKSRLQRAALAAAEDNFVRIQRRKRLLFGLAVLRSKLQARQTLELQAFSIRKGKLLSSGFTKLRQVNGEVQQMHRKAEAAQYYILTTLAFKKLTEATHQHQRVRRRLLYAQFRRQSKMNLAKNMLRRMVSRLGQIRAMDLIAAGKVDDHVLNVAISNLNIWRARAQGAMEKVHEADALNRRKTLHVCFDKWSASSQMVYRMNQDAISFSAGSIAAEAINCLRALDRRIFQISGQQQWAQALREKHREKHMKNMLRYWAERAIASRLERMGEGDVNTREHEGADDDDGNDDDRNATDGDCESPRQERIEGHDESTLRKGLNDMPNAHGDAIANENLAFTPMPGYLRTPSKRRTVKSKAREGLSAAPLTTDPTPGKVTTVQVAPATAPARQSSSSLLPNPFGSGTITPFGRKLQAQGYTERQLRISRPPLSSSGRGGGPARGIGRLATSRRTPGRTNGFAGFDDIIED